MEKVLSIVVPTYNMEALLPRCLDSFILPEEEMALLEVLVVNDGSKDRSLEIAQQYADKYPDSIKVVDKPNGNYGSCINAALKVATGKYFRICDADDNYENKNLKDYITFLTNNNTDIVFSPYNIYNCNGEIMRSINSLDELCGKTLDIDEIDWECDDFLEYRAMHCTAIKRELLIKNNYYQTEGISYTDTQFVFYSILYSSTCCFYKEFVYKYYLGRDGQTVSNAAKLKSYMHFYKNAYRMFEDYSKFNQPISKKKRHVLETLITTCLYAYAKVVICYHPNEIKNLKSFLDKIKETPYKDTIESKMFEGYIYPLWRKYHIPACLISLPYKIVFFLKGK